MNPNFVELMRNAARLTRAGRLIDATAAIQHALGVARDRAAEPERARHDASAVVDVEAHEVARHAALAVEPTPAAPTRAPVCGDLADAERFIAGQFEHAAGARAYKLYVPPDATDRSLPLLVMLHGCAQDPDDFAAGTAMNAAARERGCYVLYPEQSRRVNPQRCWNWFKANHQQRDRGEPAIIAGLMRSVIAQYRVDARRVYVAGLSAGGAMAAILGQTYPELIAAVGVHSGLAAGAAHDLPSALAAMKQGGAESPTSQASGMPTIVIHGDADSTVHPANAARIVAASAGAQAQVEVQMLADAGGRACTRELHRWPDGRVVAEYWLVHGAGHAWSGGSRDGSFTDPLGPNASALMWGFFDAQYEPARLA